MRSQKVGHDCATNTFLSDIHLSLTAVGVVKSTLQGPFLFGNVWSLGDLSFQVLRRTWSPGFIYEGTALSFRVSERVASPAIYYRSRDYAKRAWKNKTREYGRIHTYQLTLEKRVKLPVNFWCQFQCLLSMLPQQACGFTDGVFWVSPGMAY